MKKKTTTHGLSLKKVVDLLNIGTDVGTIRDDADQNRSDLLNDMLKEPLPFYKDGPSKKAGRMARTIAVLSGEPIGKLLLDPEMDIANIRKIKDHGKSLAGQTKSEAEHKAANVIYYGAIAHALAFHKEKITKFSYSDLQESFCHLSKERWIPKGLLDLFTAACKYCEGRTE